ncbi:hypothetical protein ALC60_03456 [Trachymyrmex zeteki]|uniref:GIY-YIG domain-containing protein n=1 Tax=Mycetomoellerius zeteki TaxID=64791 RepID=A0A151XAW7_9HYME|nr:hypothetical protein ALC60_03456 [Trachymyrmex zeteki]
MAYRGINKLNKFIKAQKDRLLQSSQSNLVYRIDCKDCDASYVGQMSRCLKTRINEHRNYINRNTTQLSVITQHRLESSHEFDWNNLHILDKEKIQYKRLLSEMIHIKKQKAGLNLQNDTMNLNTLYIDLFTEN